MCGIAGVISAREAGTSPGLVARMLRLMRHRGPDGERVHVAGDAVLGHVRLSIIDLAGGAQPMSNEDGTLWISFNGEIYNYVELRADLEQRGHRFATRSDTEVIVHAYEEYGPSCVESFNGQFAFAIWNSRERSLFLARDRFGKKPLYYASLPGAFVFASEAKAVLAHAGVNRDLDLRGLDQILTFWCTIAPRTVFKGVMELPPAHWLLLRGGEPRTERYWTLDFAPDETPRREEEYAEELRALLADAVRLRMVRSDVPVGAYLSGGIDSTVIAGLVARNLDARLKTFSLAFEQPEYDESAFQRKVVEHLGIRDHHETLCTSADIGAVFPELIWHAEQPLVRTAPAPMLLLSRLVRSQGYKVVLTGEGSDEILGGYDLFKEAKIREFCAQQPSSRLRPLLLKRLYPYIPALQNQSAASLQTFFHARATELSHPFFSHLPRWRMTAGIKNLLSEDVRRELADYSAIDDIQMHLPKAYEHWGLFCRAQYLESTGLLPGYILSSQGDRVQMANSVEARCPFLDYRIADFAGRLPVTLKMNVLNEKYILKRATRDLIPAFLHNRPKQPYRSTDVPCFFDARTGRARFEHVSDALSRSAIHNNGVFKADAVTRLVERAHSGQEFGVRDGMAMVSVLSTQLLLKQFSDPLGRVA